MDGRFIFKIFVARFQGFRGRQKTYPFPLAANGVQTDLVVRLTFFLLAYDAERYDPSVRGEVFRG